MKRTATAEWNGSGKEGSGHLTTQSAVLQQTQYSYNSRFAEGKGTNPEELIAAAHAGCFSMKLSFVLGAAGFTPESIQTTAEVTLEEGKIVSSNLKLQAKVPGITKEKFDECANEAKQNCPISLLLNTQINLESELTS
ncbi:MAG: OsmC family protein [Chitinophagaceae bacterium]|nr:OsmC family protein [Chitinophagaceae bacterium]